MRVLTVLFVFAGIGAGCSKPPAVSPLATAQPDTTASLLEPLRPGVWLHEAYREVDGFGRVRSNGLVVASGGEALLVNTAWGADPDAATSEVLRATEAAGLRVRRAVVTHYHNDSVAGVGALRQARIPTYATAHTARLMADAWGAPDSLLAAGDAWTLGYGDETVEVFYAGPGHTADNVVVYVPAARVLFGGCLIRPGESDNLGNTADGDLDRWDETVARVKARYGDRVEVVVPTHGAPGGPELLDHTIALVEAHRNRTTGR